MDLQSRKDCKSMSKKKKSSALVPSLSTNPLRNEIPNSPRCPLVGACALTSSPSTLTAFKTGYTEKPIHTHTHKNYTLIIPKEFPATCRKTNKIGIK
jgi:hypothetical protein